MGPTNWGMVPNANLKTMGQIPIKSPNFEIWPWRAVLVVYVQCGAKTDIIAIHSTAGQLFKIRALYDWSLAHGLQVCLMDHTPIRGAHGGNRR